MLDFDLASLYEVKTKALNQAVKRNIKRFEGEEFMFQLSREEWISFTKSVQSSIIKEIESDSFSNDYNLRSQIVTSRFSDKWGGYRQQPYAFVAYRHLAELPLAATYRDLKKQIEDLRNEVNDILADQNDINESTRAQLDAISIALAEHN